MESQREQTPGLFANLPRIPSWIWEGSLNGQSVMVGNSARKRKGYLIPAPSAWAGEGTELFESPSAVSD